MWSRPVGKTEIHTGISNQAICWGCRQLEMLLASYALDPKVRRSMVQRRIISLHADYVELDQCAQRCATCCLFRQALLLNCTTSNQATRLSLDQGSRGKPVYVTLVPRPTSAEPDRREYSPASMDVWRNSAGLIRTVDADWPDLIIRMPGTTVEDSLRITSLPSSNRESVGRFLNLHPDPLADGVRQQVLQWLEECHVNHGDACANLAWSSRNPTRLVRISNGKLCLIHPSDEGTDRFQYAALSYPWGTQTATAEDRVIVQGGMTTMKNLPSRCEKIPSKDLPATIRDSLIFCATVGIQYMWIDSLCIVQDSPDDWSREASRMHEYYGNAHFTLCATSTEGATERLFRERKAWSLGSTPCRLNGRWLSINSNLSHMRAASPLAQRAWTLQEEQLSPRILYWTPQRLFWSCARHECAERRILTPSADRMQPAKRPAHVDDLSPPAIQTQPADSAQAFLVSLRVPHASSDGGIHDQWLALLEQYTRRNLTQETDTFPALAGLAARYLDVHPSDAYIAGIWKSKFAMGLAWKVVHPSSAEGIQPKNHIAPSWSWASLPPVMSTRMAQSNTPTTAFSLLDVYYSESEIADQEEQGGEAARIARGARVNRIKVRARLRSLWSDDAVIVPWSGVASMADGKEVFSFAIMTEQNMFAIDIDSARVLAYEARREQVVAHLDYIYYAERVAVAQPRLYVLEIGQDAALVVERVAEVGFFKRVGIANDYRQDFFDGTDVTEEIYLV